MLPAPLRLAFVGQHRDETLIGLKHEFDLPHYAYGLIVADLLAA